MRLFLLLVLIYSISERPAAACKYKKYSPDHTFCKPPNNKCPMITKGMTKNDREKVLEAHNKYRSRVAQGLEKRGKSGPQPQAADMTRLVYDYSLEEVAQALANQCVFKHDCGACRRVDAYPYVGQNLFTKWSTADFPTDWTAAVGSWYEEVPMFDKTHINPFKFSMETGHYSQVVWAKTTAVGCGVSKYKDSAGKWIKQLYVCNYGPGGNMIGSSLYNVGRPCSRCPPKSTCSSKFPGLCEKRS